MAYPLSKFQHLAQLCCDREAAAKYLEKYCLTAIILHDPKNRSFRRTLSRNIDFLHENTGKNFAFITFGRPPKKWVEKHLDWMAESEKYKSTSPDGCNDSRFFSRLTKQIDCETLPAIIITPNLTSYEYAILPTSGRELRKQMVKIGKFASEHADSLFMLNPSDLWQYLFSIGNPVIKKLEGYECLASKIVDCMALFSQNGEGALFSDDKTCVNEQIQTAQNRVIQVLRKKIGQYHEIRQSSPETAQKLFDDIVEYKLLSDATRHIQFYNTLPIYPKNANVPFFPYRERYSEIAEYYANGIVGAYRLLKEGELRGIVAWEDLVAKLSKLLEDILNASIVQKMRQIKGIKMPEFYRWFHKESGAVEVNGKQINKKEIRLTREERDDIQLRTTDLVTVPIGDVKEIIEFVQKIAQNSATGKIENMNERAKELLIFQEPLRDFLVQDGKQGFKVLIKEFIDYSRNKSAHSGLYSEEFYNNAYKRFMKISKAPWFEKLFDLSDELSGKTSRPRAL